MKLIALGLVALAVGVFILAQPKIIPGDVDGNGVVEVRDAELLNDYIFHKTTKIDKKRADCNQDGVIDLKDSVCIQKKAGILYMDYEKKEG